MSVLGSLDKWVPLYIIGRAGLAGAVINEDKAPFSRTLWDLNPSGQALRETGLVMRSARLVDTGAGEAARGPGWLSLYLSSQLSFYPALSLALLATLLLLV